MKKNKTILSAIQKAWKYKSLLKSKNIDEVKNAVNEVANIYFDHKTSIKIKEDYKQFNDVEGVDFNVWAYTQLTRIESLYFDLKSRYHDLHWDLHEFNAY